MHVFSSWPLQDAKAKLSELVKKSGIEGPQMIKVRGVDTAVIISKEDFDKFTKQKDSFWDFIRKSPLVGINIKFDRAKDVDREIEL